MHTGTPVGLQPVGLCMIVTISNGLCLMVIKLAILSGTCLMIKIGLILMKFLSFVNYSYSGTLG